MKNQISILIPIYNSMCVSLVEALHKQAISIDNLDFEIIVAEDGSKDERSIKANSNIQEHKFCTHIIRKENVGRAKIRNFLAQQAQYNTLIFIDGDMKLHNDNFITNYIKVKDAQVICGGYEVLNNKQALKSNLRWCYEMKNKHLQTAEHRKKNMYENFHTSNFAIKRDIMLANPFDERFTKYGFEDVLFGKVLCEKQIQIMHINNFVLFADFEENAHFIAKTEEGLKTLHKFQNDLQNFSPLLAINKKITHYKLLPLIKIWHSVFQSLERKNLISKKPKHIIFSLYKLGFFCSL